MTGALLITTVFCFVVGVQIEELRNSKAAPILTFGAVSVLVLYLAVFKVRPLIASGLNVAVPLGISYYTFRMISYLLDVYRQRCSAERRVVPFAAYVAFFPQMVAGPIQRASSFLPQLKTPQNRQSSTVLLGLTRMMIGFFKKAIVADNLALFVNYSYQHLQAGSAIPNLVAFYTYPLQLYADFAALTDIAIGAGLLLGIESPENFNLPYCASSLTEFWRRWHMTLTSWLRDYVFVPLGWATRKWGQSGVVLSLMLTMILIGLWHGFSIGFVAFGLFNGICLVLDVLSSPGRRRYYQRNPRMATLTDFLGPVLTYNIVALGDVFFRAHTLTDAVHVLEGLTSSLGHSGAVFSALIAPPNHYAWIAIPGYVLVEIADWIRIHRGFSLPAATPRWVRWSAYACMTVTCIIVALLFLTRQTRSSPFVYEKF
jgi:D-alanyl-lipoteichoic acid acyltransferase DltB (MBOAT superfamily)